MNKKNKVEEKTKTEYIIYHGVKKVSDRRVDSFTDWNQATKFFREKEKEGVNVNMVKRYTKTIIETETII